MKNIGVIGHGFVGNALSEGMKHCFRVYIYDKKYDSKFNEYSNLPNVCIKDDNYASDWSIHPEPIKVDAETFSGIKKVDINPIEYIVYECDGPVFVCVPTPMNTDGSCNTSIVESVVMDIDKYAKPENKVVAVIKSTVIPGTTDKLNKLCKNIQVCFNPEFLTEANAINDFKNQDRIIVGGPRPATSKLKQMYMQSYPNVPVTKTGSTTAEMIKYVTNCFLATKVSFANEIKQVCDGLDIDYDKVIEYATKDKRLGNSHWAVPGPMPSSDGSGKLLPGFSGSCLIKDLNAIINKAKDLGVDPKVMKAVWQKNLEVRPEKDWEKLIGRAVSE